jgi:glycosyltransferase involved in cell wall biosynthesis
VCDHSYYDEEAKSYGSTIHTVSHPIHYFRFYNDMKKIMKMGNYDVLHCHRPEHAAGLMKIAKELAIPCRIVHSRNAIWCRGQKNPINSLRYLRYHLFIRRLLYRYATHLLAVSSDAGRFDFGEQFVYHPKCSVLFNGLLWDRYDGNMDETRRSGLLKQYCFNSVTFTFTLCFVICRLLMLNVNIVAAGN